MGTALRDLLKHGHRSATEFLMFMSPSITQTQVRNHLGHCGLNNDSAIREIYTLSAGQRVRLWFANQLLLNPKPSLLILDEVSENVDVETRNSLVELINSFNGAVLVVSHDLTFVNPWLHLHHFLRYGHYTHIA